MTYGLLVKRLSPEFCKFMDNERTRLQTSLGVPELRITDSDMSRILATKLKAVRSGYRLKKKDRKWLDIMVRVRL